jgi:hypothetical protein
MVTADGVGIDRRSNMAPVGRALARPRRESGYPGPVALLEARCCAPELSRHTVERTGLLWSPAVPVFAVATVLMLGPLIPHLHLLAGFNPWVLPGAAVTLGLGVVLLGTVTAGFDAAHPRPNSILYALNADTGKASGKRRCGAGRLDHPVPRRRRRTRIGGRLSWPDRGASRRSTCGCAAGPNIELQA